MNILIACGGTGGHLAPGIALAETLQARGHECTLLISRKQVDSMLIKKYTHLNFHKTLGQGFSGGLLRKALFFWNLLVGCLQSYRLLRKNRADFVILFGGFLSVGLGLAARFAGVPIALHEANCCPGKAVRLLKHLAVRIYLPEGVLLKSVSMKKIRYFGYPVRQEIKHRLKADVWERLGISVKNKLLVIIGGSQGASSLNSWVVENLESLRAMELSVYCVTGLGKMPEDFTKSVDADDSVKFVSFSDQMGDVLSAADLIISRAGAGSIAEIIRCRAPAILIPYPYAADDHQAANARLHEQQGACVVLKDEDLDKLLGEVEALIFNDWMLSKFKSNMTLLDQFDPAERISDDIEFLCAGKCIQNGGN